MAAPLDRTRPHLERSRRFVGRPLSGGTPTVAGRMGKASVSSSSGALLPAKPTIHKDTHEGKPHRDDIPEHNVDKEGSQHELGWSHWRPRPHLITLSVEITRVTDDGAALDAYCRPKKGRREGEEGREKNEGRDLPREEFPSLHTGFIRVPADNPSETVRERPRKRRRRKASVDGHARGEHLQASDREPPERQLKLSCWRRRWTRGHPPKVHLGRRFKPSLAPLNPASRRERSVSGPIVAGRVARHSGSNFVNARIHM